jgi:phosphoribosylformylglycinamidine cyclo-ligase
MAFREAALPVKAMAHITGGGIRENLARVLGENGADLKIPYWDHAPTQKFLDCITEETAFHTFNMGIGWMFVLPEEAADALLAAIPHASRLGSVREGSDIAIEVVR